MSSSGDRAIAVTPNKQLIIAGSGNYRDHPGYIKFWDFNTGRLIRNDPWNHYVLTSIVTTPDNLSIIIYGRDDHTYLDGTNYVYLGNIETAEYQLVKKWNYREIVLEFMRHEDFISFDRFVLDLRTKIVSQVTNDHVEQLRRLYWKVQVAPDNYLSSNDETFIIEDIRTGQIIKRFGSGHENRYHRYSPIKITSDGRYLLAQKGHDGESQNAILSMWDIQTGKLVTSFESCYGIIKAIDITSDNQYAIVYAIDPNYVI